MPSLFSEYDFIRISQPILRRNATQSKKRTDRHFKSLFGISPVVCSDLWKQLNLTINNAAKPEHLLWGLLFLKVYDTEQGNRSITGVSEKTFRKCCWIIIKGIASLKLVSLK